MSSKLYQEACFDALGRVRHPVNQISDPFKCGNEKTYIKKRGDPYAPDPNKYRHGVLSFGMGPVSFGFDSEKIRYGIQNVIVHNLTGSRYFRYERNVKDKRYIQFGAG